MNTIRQEMFVNKDDYKCLTVCEEQFPTLSEEEIKAAFAIKVMEMIPIYNGDYLKMDESKYLFNDKSNNTITKISLEEKVMENEHND